MRQDLRWKVATILIITLVFALVISPMAKTFFKGEPIRLGLDLKGGMELLLAPDYRLGSNAVFRIGDELTAKLKQANIDAQVAPLGVLDGDRYDGLKFTFANAGDVERALNSGAFPSRYQLNLFGEEKNLNFETAIQGNVVDLKILQDPRDFPEDSLERSQAIIDNRISEAASGMAEADVRLDGKGRVNVQLPGISSLQQAKELITATGRLTFRIDNKIVLDGTDLRDIKVGFDAQGGKGYVINFTFKGQGAKQLEAVTSANVGKKMAVYLDESMLMEPVIQTALPDGSGQITFGNATSKEEIEKYALLMKSGALPLSLKIVQSTQVAPTLGKEIVQQSLVAGVIGFAMVIVFMIVFYSLPGLLADVALIIYGILLLGVMAIFRGVLTLPGIAGFILTLGMAVDANIIIFERIKDEIRNGKRVRAAIQGGFNRAFSAVFDSNLTTILSAIVLWIFGSGSIKGFALTLGLGVLISMFTAIFVTRVFLEWRTDHDPDRYAKFFGAKEVKES